MVDESTITPEFMLASAARNNGWVVSPPLEALPLSMEMLIQQIKECLKAKLSYPALLTTLTIPEICIGLELPIQTFVTGRHYKEFLSEYTDELNLGINPNECWSLRGGVVHRGSAVGHPNNRFWKVIFQEETKGHTIHGGTLKQGGKVGVSISLVRFVLTMEIAARKWYAKKKNDPQVVKNLENSLIYDDDAFRLFEGIKGPPMAALVSGPPWPPPLTA